MRRLRSHLLREGRRERARPTLVEALLAGRGVAYASYRLRFLLLRTLLRTLLHAVEIYFLSRSLPWELLAPLLSYRAVTSLLASGYWGALEGLRSGVRARVRLRRYDQARKLVEAWLGLAIVLGTIGVLSECAFILFAPAHPSDSGFNLFDAYGLSCFLRLFFDLVSRTYHNGIFALRRVYRPLASFVLPDLVELLAVIIAWRELGPWGLPLSITLVGAWRSGLSLRYASRAFGRSRMGAPRFSQALLRARDLSWHDLKAAGVHAAANASSQVDALLLLVLAQTPSSGSFSMATLVYALKPVLSAAHAWTRTFYFDLVQLDSGGARFLVPHLLRFLRRVSNVVALIVGLLVFSFCLAFLPGEAVVRALWLLPLFAARSAFSLEQLRLFAAGAYADLSRVTLLIVLALGVFAWSGTADAVVVTVLAIVLVLAALWARRLGRVTGRDLSQRVGLAEWLSRVQRAPQPCVLVFGCVRSEVAGVGRVLLALTEPNSFGARLGRRHFLWALPGDLTFSRARVLSKTGGALRTLTLVTGDSGALSLAALRDLRVLPLELDKRLREAGPHLSALTERFVRDFPGGTWLDLTRGRGRLSGAVDRECLRALLGAIQQAGGARTRSSYEVAVYAPHGAPRAVYLVPRGTPGFAELAREIELCACHDALGVA